MAGLSFFNPNTLSLVTQLISLGAGIVTIIRHKDGSLSILQVLDETDTNYNADLKAWADFTASKAAVQPPATPIKPIGEPGTPGA